MDKLQWFKFTPSDWMMGKIQRCPETTQSRFIRLCCLYWNNECELSKEDAEIEIDKEHLDILIAKKIICIDSELIYIDFLDIQYHDINESANKKSESGKIGNLKRWYPNIYKRYKNKEISLTDAIAIADQSQPNRKISQKRKEKIRKEEIREEEIRKDKFNIIDIENHFSKIADETQLDKDKLLKKVYQAFEYYKELNWSDGQGTPVKNLKLKIFNNWIRDYDEYKKEDRWAKHKKIAL